MQDAYRTYRYDGTRGGGPVTDMAHNHQLSLVPVKMYLFEKERKQLFDLDKTICQLNWYPVLS